MVTKDYIEQLPIIIGIKEVQTILGIGSSRAYELAREKNFPKLPMDKPIRIPKDKFLEWASLK